MKCIRVPKISVLAAILMLLTLFGCVTEPDPLDMTQDESVNKAMFDGEWYYKVTVTDTEWHNKVSFIGEETQTFMGIAYKVRFEITHDLLNGYLIPQTYLDKDGNKVKNTIGKESLVLSFPIIKHFDIKYMQNNTTREELNVIVENTSDRPWNEREYMLVDWSKNLVTDFWVPMGAESASGEIIRDPVAVWKNVEFFDTNDELVETKAWNPKEDPDVYVMNLDIQEKIHGNLKYSWLKYYNAVQESANVKYRISLRKVEPKGAAPSSYVPMQYRDELFRHFGYFRTEYTTYDPDYGPLESQKQYLINRFDTSCSQDPNTGVPTCKTIDFHMSPWSPTRSQDPDLYTWLDEVVDAWNETLQEATGRSDQVLRLVENELVRDATGAPVIKPDGSLRYKYELGDIRYNFINYINKQNQGSPLGYGPFTPDSDTGEIINANVNVYGNWVDYVVSRAMDYYDVVSGNCTFEDIAAGNRWDEQTGSCSGGTGTNTQADYTDPSLQEGKSYGRVNMEFITPAMRTSYWPKSNISKADTQVDEAVFQDSLIGLKVMHEELLDMEDPMDLGKFQVVEGTKFEEMMIPTATFSSSFPYSESVGDVMDSFAVSNRLSYGNLFELRNHYESHGKHCRMAPDHFDNNIMAFVEDMEGKSREEIKRELRRWIVYTTTLHEMGHTLGLRHNFKGSADAANFPEEYHEAHDEYWTEREELDAIYGPAIRNGNAQAYMEYTEAVHAIPSAHSRHATSSIMDYAGDFDGWVEMPSYDRAAINFGYGEKVEVYEDGEWVFKPYVSGDGTGSGDFDDEDPHDPSSVSGSGRVVRDYLFCSDERVWDDMFCSRFDRGVTATEIVRNFIQDEYRSYFFNNFKRDRESFGNGSGYFRKWMKYYNAAKALPQMTIQRIWYDDFFDSLIDGINPALNGPEDRHLTPGYRSNGGEDLLRATQLFYYYLLYDVLQRPDYGTHILTKDGLGNSYFAPVDPDFVGPDDTVAVIEPGAGWGWQDQWATQLDTEVYDDKLLRKGTELDKIIAYEILSIPSVMNEYLQHEKANGASYWNNFLSGNGIQLWKTTGSFINGVFKHGQNPYCMDENGNLYTYPTGLLDGALAAEVFTLNSGPYEMPETRCPAGSYPVQPGMDDLYPIYPIFYGLAGSQHPWYHNQLSDYMDSQVEGSNRFDIPEGATYAEFLNSTGTKTYQALADDQGYSVSYPMVQQAQQISNRIRFMRKCAESATTGTEAVFNPEELIGTHGRVCVEVVGTDGNSGCAAWSGAPAFCEEEGWDPSYAGGSDVFVWRDVDRIEAMLIMMQDMIDLVGHYSWKTPGYLDEP